MLDQMRLFARYVLPAFPERSTPGKLIPADAR
jgi:hypothetical protein